MRALILMCSLLVLTSAATADEMLVKRIEGILTDSGRPEADRARDDNRSPAETLDFFGIKDDMRVLELVPGGGWYTRILAPLLNDRGKLFVALGTSRVSNGLLKDPGFEKVTVLEADVTFDRTGPFGTVNIQPFALAQGDMDLVVTFRNMHNFTESSRRIINESAYKALKPGGLYGVVDHTQRHMEPLTAENRRRIDPVRVIKEVQSVGFELVDFSDVHYRPDDGLRFEVGRKSVTGNTDRFTLLFRKAR